MKIKLFYGAVVVLLLLVLLSYNESVVLMRGDYLFSKWIGVSETNKSWLMLLFWIIVGGTTPYICWKVFGKARKKKGVK